MKALILLLAAAVAGAAAFTILRPHNQSAVATESLALTGTIEAREIEVSSERAGRLLELPVEEGQAVKRGDVIAVLDDAESRLQVQRIEARIQGAEAELADLKAPPKYAELTLQKARIDQAQVTLEQERARLQRVSGLKERSVVSPAEADDARFAFDAAQQRIEVERRALALLGAGPRETQIKVAEARMAELQGELAMAKLEVERARVLAPADGVVLVRQHEVGETVERGAPLVTLVDLSHLWVEVFADEQVHGALALNDKVKITPEGLSGVTAAGHVSYIADRHAFTPRNVQTRSERALLSFRVKVNLDQPPAELKPGMFVDVTFPGKASR